MIKKQIAKLIDLKSIITLIMTVVMAFLLLGAFTPQPEVLALFSTAYGSITTYFFTKASKVGDKNDGNDDNN